MLIERAKNTTYLLWRIAVVMPIFILQRTVWWGVLTSTLLDSFRKSSENVWEANLRKLKIKLQAQLRMLRLRRVWIFQWVSSKKLIGYSNIFQGLLKGDSKSRFHTGFSHKSRPEIAWKFTQSRWMPDWSFTKSRNFFLPIPVFTL